MSNVRRLTLLALLTALSLSLFVLESALPVPFLAPGAKLGLANIVTVLALYLLPRAGDALLVLAARLLLGAMFGGGPTVLLYSASGGLLAFLGMAALQRLTLRGATTPDGTPVPLFRLPAVSAAGGFLHHVGQLLCAALLSGTPALLAYLAVLGPLGLLTGLLTGTVVALLLPRLRRALPIETKPCKNPPRML